MLRLHSNSVWVYVIGLIYSEGGQEVLRGHCWRQVDQSAGLLILLRVLGFKGLFEKEGFVHYKRVKDVQVSL